MKNKLTTNKMSEETIWTTVLSRERLEEVVQWHKEQERKEHLEKIGATK
jgi:hypothetical protein